MPLHDTDHDPFDFRADMIDPDPNDCRVCGSNRHRAKDCPELDDYLDSQQVDYGSYRDVDDLTESEYRQTMHYRRGPR